jgi:hypothetical protein
VRPVRDTTLPTKEYLKEIQPQMRSTNGRHLTRSLFLETESQHVKDLGVCSPLFTLKDRNMEKNGKTYYSLKNIYMSYDHVPGYEYQFAQDVFGSWEQWQLLCNSADLVKEHIDGWKDEQAIKLQARALEAMFKTAMFEGSKGTPAARYLADKGWQVKRGRPSKDEVEREKKIAAGVEKEINEDLERLGWKVVK